jgi:membrane-associated phospholipid phosphatase
VANFVHFVLNLLTILWHELNCFSFNFAGSFAGLGFLSWYIAGKINLFDRKGHVAKLCPVLLPLLVAALVAVSRVDDYWHHWQDVFAGALIGKFSSFNML